LGAAGSNLDPVFLNGWIAVYQCLFSLPLTVPAGMMSSPSVPPQLILQNLYHGWLCFIGVGTMESGCHPDAWCGSGPINDKLAGGSGGIWALSAAWFVNAALLCNVLYTVFMMFVLKYGSTSILFLALTILVPLGNIIFAIPSMPGTAPLHISDVIAVLVIVLGLVLYRFTDSKSIDTGEDAPVMGDDHDAPFTEEAPLLVSTDIHVPESSSSMTDDRIVGYQNGALNREGISSQQESQKQSNRPAHRRSNSGSLIVERSSSLRRSESSSLRPNSDHSLEPNESTSYQINARCRGRFRSSSITNPMDHMREPLLARCGDV
jgi:CRT-like, chloroquine-resistance transporter-like